MQDMVWRGVAHIQAGDRAEGKHLLTLAVQLEPDNATAWLWLAAVADSEDERLAALQRVVEINPANAAGRRAQARLRRDVIREVAGRIPPPAPARPLTLPAPRPVSPAEVPRELPHARPARATPRTAWPEDIIPDSRDPTPARPTCAPLLVFALLAAMFGAFAGSTVTVSVLGVRATPASTPTRVIVERTRPPATLRPPTQAPAPAPTLAPPPPPTRTPNPRFGACGRAPAQADQPTFLCIESEPGDPIGGGQARRISPTEGTFTVQWNRDRAVEARIAGADPWELVFQVPYGLQLMPGGSFERINLDAPVPAADLGLTLTGPGGTCERATGRVAILALQYQGDRITLFAADFEQHCMGDPPGLYGTLLYQAAP